MGFSYKPLWKVLVDKNKTKEDMRLEIKTSSATIAKMGKGEYVSMEVLDKICNTYNVKIEDVIEHFQNEKAPE
ncbi:helix-turn-helix transcriptional regulator [Paenibacillus anseongense]|uniref:helix-turn-helix domain-containing protein n=1 Tax=Paenibacillus anseongense TaxID=2682845 RepID=UPI002DB594D2|nr:helix-turn-helix transcriptional regulator [Paenibacillus anseongense]MEC0265165.1 helix-turn-helix transcriptional regulator [Paenibacillus anseongense]